MAIRVHGEGVLALDLAGFGGSQDHAGDTASIDDFASDVERLLGVLDVGPVVLGGLSSIGMITAPGLARRLVARDPGPFAAERLS